MSTITGDYRCKIDAKGRLILPAQMLRQFPDNSNSVFLKHSVYEKCLELYPQHVWEEKMKSLNGINTQERDNLNFIRIFFSGAHKLDIDSNNRILIPKMLLQHAQLDKDIVLKTMGDFMEIWSPENEMKKLTELTEDEIAALASRVMGKQKTNS
jgi:MraZ protein